MSTPKEKEGELTMRLLRPVIYSSAFLMALCYCARGQENMQALEVTLCELYQHPEKYAGKMVKFRATVAGWKELEVETFTRAPCPSYFQVTVVFPEKLKPAPDFDLVRDDSFKGFEDALYNKAPMRIDVTFEGRFDTVLVAQGEKRVRVGKGYGKKGDYDARIVLYRISDIWALRLPPK
jgi:hypothetical protein